MKIQANTVEEYLSRVGEREPQLRELDALIRKQAPHLQPVMVNSMASTMIGYGNMPYKTKSSKELTEWPLVLLAAQKNYMSLYLCAVEKNSQYIAEKYEKELGKVNIGKSCIRFKNLEDLNLETVKKLLKDLDKRYARGEKLFGH